MKKIAPNLLLVVAFLLLSVKAVAAADPNLYFSPATGSYHVNDTFTVTMMIDSASQKAGAVDLVGTFSSDLLEVVKMEKASGMAFDETAASGDCLLDNSSAWVTGGFREVCYSQTSVGDKLAVGNLLVVTFKAKAVGTATVSYTCTGLTGDSNITQISTVKDIIVCSANGSGSYTITAATGASTTTDPTPTTASSTSTTTTATQLPQTGGIATTLGLIVFGAISFASALFLKFL